MKRLVTAAWIRRQTARQGERAEVEWTAWREARWVVTGKRGASVKILEGGFGTNSGLPGEDAQQASALPRVPCLFVKRCARSASTQTVRGMTPMSTLGLPRRCLRRAMVL